MIPYYLDSKHELWRCWIAGRPISKKEIFVPKRGGAFQKDKRLEEWVEAMGREIKKEMVEDIFPIADPVVMMLTFYFESKTKPNLSPHTDVPDCDNITKPVCDVLETRRATKSLRKAVCKCGVIVNDKQIYSECITKVWAAEAPGLMIRLYSCVAAIDLGGGTRRL